MPDDAPRSKADAVRGYGAEIVTYDRYREDRAAIGERLADERGLALIPPYEHPDVIAGQGTVALEFIEQVGQFRHACRARRGRRTGGRLATIATALDRRTRVVGVEPAAGDDTRRSLEAGHRVSIPVPRTIADGQAVETPGELTFSLNQRMLDSVELVSDDEILDAMRFAFDRLRLVVEPSGASGLAAVLTGKVKAKSGRIGVVLSGGNIDVSRFVDLLARPQG